MRFPEAKIKQAILRAEPEIRVRAVRYFARPHSSDPSVMPLVIQAVEKFGREDAYHLIGLSRHIAQTTETVSWIIDELNQDGDQYANYTYNLSMVLLNADPSLLLPRESDILEAPHFFSELRPSFTERLQMLSLDEETCWKRLEEFCEQGKDKQYINEVNLAYGERIVEALARYGSSCEERIHGILRQKIEDYRHHPMKWLEPLAVRLAGQVQLESTIPLIVTKLQEDGGDLLNEECSQALTRIGTPAVLEAVSRVFPTATRHFRLYGIDPLENIRSDLAVEKCFDLLGQEKNWDIQINLATALLSQFATEGIHESRTLLIGHNLDFESRGLRDQLVETCDLMEERFPEYDEWKMTMKAEREEHQKRVKELEHDPVGLMHFALEKLGKSTHQAETKQETPVSPNPPTGFESKQKVGRNDPCPCGSGKKYKKCCLKKKGNDPLLN